MKTGITLSNIWNDVVVSPRDREMQRRDYAYASEMGYPLIDRFLKMNAIPMTNPPNDRARRKFFGGNVWEMIVWMAFNFAGLIISKQDTVWVDEGAIRVKGKLDFLIGGKPDFDRARKEIEGLPMPDDMKAFFNKCLVRMSETYSGEYLPCVKEIKSLSTFMFESVERKEKPIPQHELQLLHYQWGTKTERGGICYVCRDDARLREFDLENVGHLKMKYLNELYVLSEHLKSGERPLLEPLIKWDDRFSKNLGVEYSPYLELIYGFKDPEAYREAVDSKVGRWNRVLKRIKEGAKLTDNNKEALEEMQAEGYDGQKLVASLQLPAASETETE